MRNIYSCIDIGSDSVKLVVCELYKGRYNLLAATSTKSKGIKKGLIYDVNEVTNSIKQALKEIEAMLGFEIKKVLAIIPSHFADFIKIEAKIDTEDEIYSDDIVKVLQEAIRNGIIPTKEMLTAIPIDFTVEQGTVKDPTGMHSNFLETRAILVTVPKKNIESVTSILKDIGIEVVDIFLGCIGDIYAYKTHEMDNQIGAIINIGAEVTSVSLYNKGIIVKNNLISMGSKNIDNDISYMYGVSAIDAKNLKETFALAHKNGASTSETREIINKNNETLKINQFEISEIIMSRIEEILALAKTEITSLTNKQLDYIIITGGITNLPNLNQVVRDIFGNCAIIGDINLVGLRNNKYSSAIGSIIYFVNKLKLKGTEYSMVTTEEMEVSSIKSNDDNVLGKVFGYFFGE